MEVTGAQLAIIISLAGLFCTFIGLVLKLLSFMRSSRADAKAAEHRLTNVESDVKQCKDILWKMLDPLLGDLLHKPHPSHAASDRLLEEFVEGKLTNGGKAKLKAYAEKVMAETRDREDREGRRERLAAALLIWRLEMEGK